MQAFINRRKPHVNSKSSRPTLSEMGTPAKAEESNRVPKILLPRLPLPPPPGLKLMTVWSVCIPRRITSSVSGRWCDHGGHPIGSATGGGSGVDERRSSLAKPSSLSGAAKRRAREKDKSRRCGRPYNCPKATVLSPCSFVIILTCRGYI